MRLDNGSLTLIGILLAPRFTVIPGDRVRPQSGSLVPSGARLRRTPNETFAVVTMHQQDK